MYTEQVDDEEDHIKLERMLREIGIMGPMNQLYPVMVHHCFEKDFHSNRSQFYVETMLDYKIMPFKMNMLQ